MEEKASKPTITKLTTEYMERQKQIEEQRHRRLKGLKRRLSVFGVVFTALLLFAGHTIYQQNQRLEEQRVEQAELSEHLSTLLEQEERLLQEIEWLQDNEYIAELARRDYFLSKEGETLFQLPRASSDD